jgi:aminoglycoside phosphotransferase (APT) family kinase protein
VGERPCSDRDLDESIALAVVREQFPALGCCRAERLGSGWGSDAYLLDDRLVARFPRTAEAAEWVDFEHAVLALVARALSPAFAVPTVSGRGRGCARFPYDFLLCDFVRGTPADRETAPVHAELAADLGRALTRIHCVPVDAARRAGLREVEWDDSGYARPLCFLHGDFRAGNIIVDPDSGRLVGVIDWGNAAVGDPALDFATLVLWRGWAFTHRALDAYELPVDDGFLERVRYHARTQSLHSLTETVRRRADTALHLEWLLNAFSLVPAPDAER